MDENVESVKILTEKPMLNGCVTMDLECFSYDGKHWISPELFVPPDHRDTFRYHYVVKCKEGLKEWFIKKVTFSGGKDGKMLKEIKSRNLKSGNYQYDIFRSPNDHNQMKTIFLGQLYFVKWLYQILGNGGDLKEMLIECEHVGFGHPSYWMTDIETFIQWVLESISKNPTCYQCVYICSLLGQLVHRIRSLSAQYTCNLLGEKATDKLLSFLAHCSIEALPNSSATFIKVVAEDLFKAGSSIGCLLFIKIFCNLLDVNFVMQVADKLSSKSYTDHQFDQQVPSVLASLNGVKDLESCRRLCCYLIFHSPSVQCLWKLYNAISHRFPDVLHILMEEFVNVYCKFISRHRARKPDLLQPWFWSQVPENLKEKLASRFCNVLVEQISSETTWSQERLDSLMTIALDPRLHSADKFCCLILNVSSHKSKEMVSIIPVLLKSKSFCTFWDASFSPEDKLKVSWNWLRAQYTGKKQKEQILDVVEACGTLCGTDALKTDDTLCSAVHKKVEDLVLKAKFQSIMEAVVDAHNRSPTIQQRLVVLLRMAIKQQSGTGDRRSKYRQMIRLLGYDVSKERKKDLQKMKLDR